MKPTVIVNETLREAVTQLGKLVAQAKTDQYPSTAAEALAWINTAPDQASRAARKSLSFGLRYGSGPQKLAKIIKER